MDISNATAAGPSRGLLDVIFGSNQGPEEAEADGQGFGNLMNLIKVLNMKKEAEEKGGDPSRTQRETVPGKSIAGGGAVGMPGMNTATPNLEEGQLALMQDLQDQEQREKLQRLSMLGIPPAMMAAQAQVPALPALEGVQAEQVNVALRQKGLPPLSPQEMKLLQDVNGKIAQANGQPQSGAEIPPELLAAGAGADPVKTSALPKAASPGQPIDPALQKAMAAKGVDPRKLKAAEASAPQGTPEKMLPTETYLQLHESANAAGANAQAKPQGKELAGKGPQLAGADQSAAAKPEAALTAGAVAGAAEKGPALGSRKGDDGAQLPEGSKQAKLDALATGGFGGTLAQQKSEAMKHDVYLPGADKPEQRANVLVAELGSGVAFHAHKGGGEMRLVIHPDDLGEVKLKVETKNGKVEVHVMAENEDVAKMIRGGSKELEASLKEQNLSLAKFEVSVSDSSSVVSTDTKSGLNEQFLSQNQQQHNGGGFSQGSLNDDSRSARWGTEQGSRQGGGHNAMAEDSGRSVAKAAPFVPKTTARAMMGSGRLDVVA